MTPSAFHDLPPQAFPVIVEMWAYGADRAGPPTWSATVPGPGSLVVPGLGPGTWVRMTYADGDVFASDDQARP